MKTKFRTLMTVTEPVFETVVYLTRLFGRQDIIQNLQLSDFDPQPNVTALNYMNKW
jgi:hypothetical protein